MKKNSKTILVNREKVYGGFCALLLCVFNTQGFSQQTYSFTPCTATGLNGPTQAQVNTAYAATNLAGAVTINTAGVQSWTVPFTGAFSFTASGAQGGHSIQNGGLGSTVAGQFNLTAGQVLNIVVGQKGLNESGDSNRSGGGGGGSFVYSGNTLLMAAGGGAGRTGYQNGSYNFPTANSNTTAAGNAGSGWSIGSGGAAGSGGNGGSGSTYGGGGAGWLTDGGDANSYAGNQQGFSLGGLWIGGTAPGGGGDGGFGGGGAGGIAYGGGGGGGGYSGGGGGTDPGSGGGGGSYNGGTNQVNTASVNIGDGTVIITSLCNVQVNGLTTICTGQTTTLTTTAVSNILWNTGSTAPSIVVSPQATTQYSVTGIGSLNNCNSAIVFSVVVNPLPVITPGINPPLLCVGSTATITASGAASNSYSWSTGPFLTNSITANPIVTTTYNVAGTSVVGCVNSSVFTINVDNLALSIAGNTAVCLGNSTNLMGSGGTSLSWNGYGPFASIAPTPTVPTTYTLTGIDANNCLISKTIFVTVNQNPVVTASASKTLVCKNQSITLSASGADTYVWSASAGAATTASVTVTLPINTTYDYSVTGTDANGCINTSLVSARADLCTGINELTGSAVSIVIYPNPNNGTFTLKASEGSKLFIVNATGQIVRSITATSSNEVSIEGLSKGIYFVTGEQNGMSINKKIIVE